MITLVKWIVGISLSLLSSNALAQQRITFNTPEETINYEIENSNCIDFFENKKETLQYLVATSETIVFYQDTF